MFKCCMLFVVYRGEYSVWIRFPRTLRRNGYTYEHRIEIFILRKDHTLQLTPTYLDIEGGSHINYLFASIIWRIWRRRVLIHRKLIYGFGRDDRLWRFRTVKMILFGIARFEGLRGRTRSLVNGVRSCIFNSWRHQISALLTAHFCLLTLNEQIVEFKEILRCFLASCQFVFMFVLNLPSILKPIDCVSWRLILPSNVLN